MSGLFRFLLRPLCWIGVHDHGRTIYVAYYIEKEHGLCARCGGDPIWV